MKARQIAGMMALAMVGACLVQAQTQPDVLPDAEVLRRLNENLKELTSNAQGLEKVLTFMSDIGNVTITADWPALEGVGIDRNKPITVDLREMSVAKCLDVIMASADGGKGLLVLQVKNGGAIITTRRNVAKPSTTRAETMPTPATQK